MNNQLTNLKYFLFLFLTYCVLPSLLIGQTIYLEEVEPNINRPVGLDYHVPTNSLIMSLNYPSGQPHNFERLSIGGTRTTFSNVSGIPDEVNLATVKEDLGGFTTGDLFAGNGVPGQILRIRENPGGTFSVVNPWANLGNVGLLRGDLYHDRTGVFGNDLIAVTTGGYVYRIDENGTGTQIAFVNDFLEGVCTIPNNPAKYGDLAGKILAGSDPTPHTLYAISANGNVDTYNLTVQVNNTTYDVNIENIDLIPANEDFFGVIFNGPDNTGKILGASSSSFTGYEGDILITQQIHNVTIGGGSGLFILRWDFDSNPPGPEVIPFSLANGSEVPTYWEEITFSSAGPALIPTMGQWGLVVLSIIMLIIGLAVVRQRKVIFG